MKVFDPLKVRTELQNAGVLPTLQRIAVAAVLMQRPAPMTPEQILNGTRELLPGISRTTVDRVLRLFARKGLLHGVRTDVPAG